ncbi:MAG: NAD(P)/FAD-dependent oxidoreductase [Oricola sp.]
MPIQGTFSSHYDAIVVGARCAGAATAMLLARQGARVLMIDSGAQGTDTMSTHALMRGAVMQLTSWGLLDRIERAGTPPIRSTAFVYGSEAIEVEIKPSHGVDALYAPRRYVLDSILVEAAIEAGVDARFGVTCRGLLHGPDGRVRGILAGVEGGATFSVTGDIVIGADGRRSAVARFVNAAVVRQSDHATSVVYGYFDGIEHRGNRWYFMPGLSAGAIPTNAGQTCVFVAMPRQFYLSSVRGFLDDGLHTVACAFPELRAALATANLTARPVGFIGQKGHMRRAAGPGWALVGDAGYFKDPLTAHGITDALRDAEILARAFAGGASTLDGYQQTRDALSRELFEVTDAIASLTWSLEELKVLHMRLNGIMKEEQDWIQNEFARDLRAA